MHISIELSQDSDTEDEDLEEEDEGESYFDFPETDPSVPKSFKQLIVFSTRADGIVGKSLGISNK